MKNRNNKANRSYMVKRRRAAAKAGKCVTCCVRTPLPEKKTCETCLSGARRIKSGVEFCVRCASFHSAKCMPVVRLLRRAE